MAEGISANGGALSFGNYRSRFKVKVNNYEYMGARYNLRSHDEFTRLHKNGGLLYESVPGSRVRDLVASAESVSFGVEGAGSAQIILEMEPNAKYKIFIDDVTLDSNAVSNSSGKINFSLSLDESPRWVKVEKVKKADKTP
jgi:hypothetical protein